MTDSLQEKYAGRSKEGWIAWAEREIKEYEEFIRFLKGEDTWKKDVHTADRKSRLKSK